MSKSGKHHGRSNHKSTYKKLITRLPLNALGYDYTSDMYKQRAWDIAARSQGLERFIWAVFGPDLIGSLALALDPWAKFEVDPVYTQLLSDGAPRIRTRDIVTYSGISRSEVYLRTNDGWGYRPNTDTSYPLDYYLTGPERTIVTSGTASRAQQNAIHGFIKDSTRRTRKLGASQGELEMFIPTYSSPGVRYSYRYQDSHVQNHIGTGLQDTRTVKIDSGYSKGPEIACDNASIQALYSATNTRALAAMQEHTLGLLDFLLPEHKAYDFTYQIAELKDLAFTVRASLEIWRAFERSVGTPVFSSLLLSAKVWRNPALIRKYKIQLGSKTGFKIDPLLDIDQLAANAYLTFKFGWASMVQAVSQLLPSPGKITKRVNYLIDRIGKDTNFHTKKKWYEKPTSSPTFSGNLAHFEALYQNPTHPLVSGVRECEIRLQANVMVKFPPMSIPKLRNYLTAKQFGVNLTDRGLGLYLTPGQIYNLIPFTWMLDWFNGLGDYIQLMDTITADRSLVNYGFCTYREISTYTASFTGKFVGTWATKFDSSEASGTTSTNLDHTGKLRVKYHLRKALSQVASVKTHSDEGNSLSPTQKAILVALANKFGPGAKHGA